MLTKFVDVSAYRPDGTPNITNMDFIKVAELHDAAKKAMSKIKPEPGYSFVLVTAVEAGDFWGPNSRGDFFTEEGLLQPSAVYGFKSFLKAKHYAHHKHTDTFVVGEVVDAVYNHDMHWVEVILKVDRKRAKELGLDWYINAIDNNQPVDYSMGCRTPFDLCSIHTDLTLIKKLQSEAGPDPEKQVKYILEYHKKHPIKGLARTLSDYCDLRKHHMNQVLPDGRRVYNVTPYPNFFDVSVVNVGAGPTAKLITKVASAKPLKKHATITKQVPAKKVPVDEELASPEVKAKLDLLEYDKDLPKEFLLRPIKQVLADTLTNKIILKPHEFFASLLSTKHPSLAKLLLTLPAVPAFDGPITMGEMPECRALMGIGRPLPMALLRERGLDEPLLLDRLWERQHSPIVVKRVRIIALGIPKQASAKMWQSYVAYRKTAADILSDELTKTASAEALIIGVPLVSLLTTIYMKHAGYNIGSNFTKNLEVIGGAYLATNTVPALLEALKKFEH